MRLLRILLFLLACTPVVVLSLSLQDIPQVFIILLPLFSSYCLSAVIADGKDNLIYRLNTWFIILCCQVVITAQILSFFHILHWGAFLIASLAPAGISVLVCSRLKDVWRADQRRLKRYYEALCDIARYDVTIKWFLIILAGSLLWRVFLILYVPPNNFDSMTYHLSRVAYWMQQGSFDYFPTHNLRQVQNSFNAEILFMWLMLQSRNDFLCGFIQFVCYLLSGTLIFQGARVHLRAGLKPALLCSLFWYSLPLAVAQSTSTQNDLVVSYFLAAGFMYVLSGMSGNKKMLVVSGLAVGFAVGTKPTSFIFLLLLACVMIVFVWKKIMLTKTLFFWGGMCLAASIALGAYSYVQNIAIVGKPLANDAQYMGVRISSPHGAFSGYLSSFFQSLYYIVSDESGTYALTPRAAHWYNIISGYSGTFWFRAFHIPTNVDGFYNPKKPFAFYYSMKCKLHEDNAGYGLLGAIMIIEAFMVCIIFFLWRRKRVAAECVRYLIPSFFLIGTIILVSFLLKWNFSNTRYIMAAVLVGGVPLLLLVIDSERKPVLFFRNALCAYCIVILLSGTFMNTKKPLQDIIYKERSQLRYRLQAGLFEIMQLIDARVRGRRVGVILGPLDWDYPIFGQKLRRKVIPITRKNITKRFTYIIATSPRLAQVPALVQMLAQDYKLEAELGICGESVWMLFVLK
ncbi:MAG: hypothetical protein ABH865_00070 [Candidatus Omnitrophota bacterium]